MAYVENKNYKSKSNKQDNSRGNDRSYSKKPSSGGYDNFLNSGRRPNRNSDRPWRSYGNKR